LGEGGKAAAMSARAKRDRLDAGRKSWRKESATSSLHIYEQMRRDGLLPLLLQDYNELLNKVAPKYPDAAFSILDEMTKARVQPDEASFLALIRAAAAAGDAATKGPLILDEMQAHGVQPRLRSFVPLLESACDKRPAPDLPMVLGLCLRMRDAGVTPREEHVFGLLRALLLGDTARLGNSAGGLVWRAFGEVLRRDLLPHNLALSPRFAKGVLELMSEHQAEAGRRSVSAPLPGRPSLWSFLFSGRAAPAPVLHPAPVARRGSLGSVCGVAREVDLSPAGECPCCGHRARLLGLSPLEARTMRSNLMEIAARSDIDQHHNLKEFSEWLASRGGKPFTAVVDGANVAYSKQNHARGQFSFAQIQAVVDELLARGERPLIVLPRKYLREGVIVNHSIRAGRSSSPSAARSNPVSAEDEALRKLWAEKDMVYSPRFRWADDDWYWMYATLTQEGAFVVTNDEMRDHRLGLLGPREFRRWREKHVVRFDLGAGGGQWPNDDGLESPPPLDVTIVPTALFSRESQQVEGHPRHWHLPIGDRARDPGRSWLCLALPEGAAEGDAAEGGAVRALLEGLALPDQK